MSVRIEQSIAERAGDWEELADRVGAAPWMRPGWIEAWWRAFGRGSLELLCVCRGAELVGLVPLVRRRGSLAAPANSHSPAFAPLAVDGEAMAELSHALLSWPRTAQITLRPVPDGEAARQLRSAAGAKGWRLLEHTELRSPYVSLDGSIADFHARSRPSKSVLKEIRRCRRRLGAEGEVRFEVSDGAERFHPLLEECFEVEAAGWQGANGSAMSSRSTTRSFYTEVARWAAERGWLRLLFLRVGERAIAAELCLVFDGVLFDVKGGYRTEHRKMGPGKIIALEAIEWAYEQGLRGLDLTGGDDAYKLQWTDHVRERSVLRIFPRSPAGTAAWSGWAQLRPLALGGLEAARSIRERDSRD